MEPGFVKTLCRLNCADLLDDLTELLRPPSPEDVVTAYRATPKGRILVIGGTKCKKNELVAIGKSLGIRKDRFEFRLNYSESKRYPYGRLYLNEMYAVVLVGPVPHKTIEMDSVLSNMEQTPGYPPVARLGTNELKITKSNFRACLQDLIRQRIVMPG